MRRSKEENLIIKGVEGFKSNHCNLADKQYTHVLQKTTLYPHRILELRFTVPSTVDFNAIKTAIVAALAAFGEVLDIPDTNFRYRALSNGKWVHVHGPLIPSGCEYETNEIYLLQRTGPNGSKDELEFTASSTADFNAIVAAIIAALAALGEGLDIPDTNFRYSPGPVE